MNLALAMRSLLAAFLPDPRARRRLVRSPACLPVAALVLSSPVSNVARAEYLENFESPPVHPVAMTPDGNRLLVAHTADARLVVFDLMGDDGPVLAQEIQVGLDPVTVRARTGTEAWVVNHISDSISIVDLETGTVVRTLLVGDEPTDVVFAGVSQRAFVCLSQEDAIRVFDPADLDAPAVTIPLLASDPRSLAVSPDGGAVYVCALDSGNNTTIVPWRFVEQGGGAPPPIPPPGVDMPDPPRAGLIVRHDGAHWVDERGRSWDPYAPYLVLDNDVLAIDAGSLRVTRAFRGVGTSLMNLAVHPRTGRIYCSNIEALNHVRFEPVLRGRFAENRVTVIDPAAGAVRPRDLNAHVSHGFSFGTPEERARSLAFPLDLAVDPETERVYLAAFGSSRLGVLDADGRVVGRIAVGHGPAGIALDPARGCLYVFNRFDGTLSVVDVASQRETGVVSVGYDPTPTEVARGRRLLYDGEATSAHGDLACGTCHIFGGTDNLAWDLGNPLGEYIPPPGPGFSGLHPMKGPMVTQSLKGLHGTEPFHWRGDRAGLEDFNPAFVSLMGRESPLGPDDFRDFESFVFSMRYPPNPFRSLDGGLPDPPGGPSAARGEDLFLHGRLAAGFINCVDCHGLPSGTIGSLVHHTDLLQDQDMKIPQLRNLYEKSRFDNTARATVRAFGFTHEGSVDDLQSFLSSPRFLFENDQQKHDVAAFLFAFSTDTHAAVGAQWTFDGTNEAAGRARLDILALLADMDAIGIVAKGTDASGTARGWMYELGYWMADRLSDPPLETDALLAAAGVGTEITVTAVIDGTERRLGIDRDGDGVYDRDEIDAGFDPGDPSSRPLSAGLADAGAVGGIRLRLDPPSPNPAFVESRIPVLLPAGPGGARITIHGADGRIVRRLDFGRAGGQAGPETAIVWDLRDERGRPASAGTYFVRLSAQGHAAVRRLTIAH